MRVFVTGATGFVGSVVVPELLRAGHSVLGVARTDAGAAALKAAGADVHRGSLEDPDSLARGAAACDGTIHLAFIHDFTKFAENGEIERRAIEAMGTALAGSNKPFIVTSGVALLSPGGIATEDMVAPSGSPRASESAAFAFVDRGVRVSAIRLAPSVHGGAHAGLVDILRDTARNTGSSVYVGDGTNRWAAVHRLDAAVLYRLALEKGEAGARYHGIDEEGVRLKDIAGVIGRRMDLPVVSKTPEQAAEHFGWMAMFAAVDAPASSAKTRRQLGWKPVHGGLIADIDTAAYCESQR